MPTSRLGCSQQWQMTPLWGVIDHPARGSRSRPLPVGPPWSSPTGPSGPGRTRGGAPLTVVGPPRRSLKSLPGQGTAGTGTPLWDHFGSKLRFPSHAKMGNFAVPDQHNNNWLANANMGTSAIAAWHYDISTRHPQLRRTMCRSQCRSPKTATTPAWPGAEPTVWPLWSTQLVRCRHATTRGRDAVVVVVASYSFCKS